MRSLLLIGILSIGLAACGIKGPLELPHPQPPKAAPAPATGN